MKKRYISILGLVLSFVTFSINAQETPIFLTGKILDQSTRQPIEYATIVAKQRTTNDVLGGATTDSEGIFAIKAKGTDFYLEISFIGFQTKSIEEVLLENGRADLGEILLSDNSTELGDVVVQAERSTTEFRLDKRVFNVGQDLSSAGGSALDVLNHVPSVNVSIEGQVTLRGSSGVQILINGKPSVIASEEGKGLGTITAAMIEKVEVITNPSAKYQAEGTAGILNIILKKEERKGINGSLSVNTGIPHNHSAGLSLNRRSEKWNLFSQLGVGYRELPEKNRNINENRITVTRLESEGTEFRNEFFYNVVLGTDYYIDPNNIITISGNIALELEDQPSDFTFFQRDGSGSLESTWTRSETTTATNPKYQYEAQYKRDFKDHKDHDLVFSAVGNFFGKEQSSVFSNFDLDGEAFGEQRTATDFLEGRHTFQLDYTHPFLEKYSIETGLHYLLNNVGNDFEVLDKIGDEFVINPALTNDFEYTQNVFGAYTTGSFEGAKWGVKLGLRLENTDLRTFLVDTQEGNDQNFNNLFPTLHTSYKISEALSLQVGYSRRIFRPRLWDLNPFFNIRNNFNIRTGNPNLLPEYTDSYELMAVQIFERASLNYGIFHRYTTDVIDRISTFDGQVSTTQPYNIGTRSNTGFELNGKYNPAKWLSFNGDFNLNYFQRKGDFEGTNFDFDGQQWSSKLSAKVKLPAQIEFEITENVFSDVQTVQGNASGNAHTDIGIRKKIKKGRGIFNLSVRDLFATRIRESEAITSDFYLYDYSLRGRFVTVGFSYGFGKGEAMEYLGQRRR